MADNPADSDSPEAEPWDHTYKGDSYWTRLRSETLRLTMTEVAIGFSDVEADPWFQKESHVEQAIQWSRARKKLVRGRLRADGDVSDLVQFYVETKGGRKWYLARREEMHCASAIAVLKEHVAANMRALRVRNLRRQWNAEESCPVCDAEDRIVYNADLSGEIIRRTSNPKRPTRTLDSGDMGGEAT